MPKLNLKPKEQGFFFPAEWHHQRAMWLSFPKNVDTWEDRFEKIYPAYFGFIKAVSEGQKVCINVDNESFKTLVSNKINEFGINQEQVEICIHPTNDSWCRDHGPAFLINTETKQKLIVEWGYNAWGGKYPPFDDDDNIPIRVADYLKIDYVEPRIIMEGGSVEFNGKGTILTSKSCLLNKNRNPHLNQKQIEQYLFDFYGAEKILWVEDGIVGDDTDGHIDDTTRFVNEDTVIACVEHNKNDENFLPLKENLKLLKKMRLQNDKQLNIIELPMPKAVFDSNLRLPASYANFYIGNKVVVVPTFRSKNEDQALQIIRDAFPTRKIVGIDATEIIWGLGSFHCLSQQEPDFD